MTTKSAMLENQLQVDQLVDSIDGLLENEIDEMQYCLRKAGTATRMVLVSEYLTRLTAIHGVNTLLSVGSHLYPTVITLQNEQITAFDQALSLACAVAEDAVDQLALEHVTPTAEEFISALNNLVAISRLSGQWDN
jgi:hypothetical protein